MIADRRHLAFATFGPRPLEPLTGLWVTAFFSHRYSNSEASNASRWRTAMPGLDQTAVSASRLVLGTRIDAEFLSDMGELFRVHETAVCHHRAQGR